MAIKKPSKNAEYYRIGCDYFKSFKKPDSFDIMRNELRAWKRAEIELDFGKIFLKDIPKFNDFINIPDNLGTAKVPDGFYNLFKDNPIKPIKGSWKWTLILMKHIFGTQFKMGMQYMQILYLYPKQLLPVLALVSAERETAKTTFLTWFNSIFGANMYLMNSDDLSRRFNAHFASCLIIGIDESIINSNFKQNAAMAKLKSLSTAKQISVEFKGVDSFQIPFYGKFILTSNNEDDFINVDQEEIRFWIKKLKKPKIKNHNILHDLVNEIPAFLYYLQSMPVPDFSQSRMFFTAKQLLNKELSNIKKESKSALYKEISELVTDYFEDNNNFQLFFTPTDLKKRWFNDSFNVRNVDIKKCLKKEFNLIPEPNSIYYKPLGDEVIGKNGRYYTFHRIDFTDSEPQPSF